MKDKDMVHSGEKHHVTRNLSTYSDVCSASGALLHSCLLESLASLISSATTYIKD